LAYGKNCSIRCWCKANGYRGIGPHAHYGVSTRDGRNGFFVHVFAGSTGCRADRGISGWRTVRWDGSPSEVASFIDGLCVKIEQKWPELRIIRVDERFTSSLAADALVKGGMKKSKRQEKGAVDKVAAALILENYLAQR